MDMAFWVPVAFFFVAFFYSMVGFGGGSSYLAILVLSGLSYVQIPSVALACNLVVTLGGFFHFYKNRLFCWDILLPFITLSIPLSYVGGRWAISRELFAMLLGVSLLCAFVRMILPDKHFEVTKSISRRQMWSFGLPVGAGLGFLSGLVGIGGGIFLSPILLMMRWVTVREAAASACFFIIVNSVAGLIGQCQKADLNVALFLPLGAAVFFGGQLGSCLGVYRIPAMVLKQLLAILVLYISLKLIGTAL